jgi:transposase
MSGGRSESVATFYTALDKSKSVRSELLEKLEQNIENLASAHVAKGKVKSELEKGEDKILKEADKSHKELQKLIKQYFEKDPNFRREFAYEAMTGETKFGGNIGTCTHFLVVS